jgi:hypothetical protein
LVICSPVYGPMRTGRLPLPVGTLVVGAGDRLTGMVPGRPVAGVQACGGLADAGRTDQQDRRAAAADDHHQQDADGEGQLLHCGGVARSTSQSPPARIRVTV